METPSSFYDEKELLRHLQLRYRSPEFVDGNYLGRDFRYPQQLASVQLDITDTNRPNYRNFITGGMPEPPLRLDPNMVGLSDDILENIANTQRARDANPKPRGVIFPKKVLVSNGSFPLPPTHDPVNAEYNIQKLTQHINLTKQSLSQLDRNQIHGYGDFNWEAEKPPIQKQLFILEKQLQYETENYAKLNTAANRQVQIRDLRLAQPHIDLLAEEVESRAAKAWSMLERPTSSGKIVHVNPIELVRANTPEASAFKSYLVKAKGALSALDVELGKSGLNSREFLGKNGYILGVSGNIPMIADAGRLMGGGGIGVSPDGLPMIQSKSEMQQDAGIPEELRGSFRISTDEEMASYRKDLAKQDAENKRLEEVGRVLLAKQERKKMNNAIDAGAEMMGKLSANKDWSKILGF